MKLHQLSVFLENRPHQVRGPIRLLAEAGIDILTMTLADSGQFGILRLIVDDWEKARDVLEKSGRAVTVTEVVAIEVLDRPGGLDQVLARMEKADLNIEYMYSCTFHRGTHAVMVFRFEQDLDTAISALQAAGVNVVERADVFSRGR